MGLLKWLNEKLTGVKKEEITKMRQKLRQQIKETCEKARKGDTDASLKLAKLEESITEQSLRLTGKPKPPSTVILPPGTMHP